MAFPHDRRGAVVSSSRQRAAPPRQSDDPESATFLFFFILRRAPQKAAARAQRLGGGNDAPRSHDPTRGDRLEAWSIAQAEIWYDQQASVFDGRGCGPDRVRLERRIQESARGTRLVASTLRRSGQDRGRERRT